MEKARSGDRPRQSQGRRPLYDRNAFQARGRAQGLCRCHDARALARKRQIKVTERAIMPDELAGFENCFIVGTAAEVTPVGEIGPCNFTVSDMVRTLRADYLAEVQPKKKAA